MRMVQGDSGSRRASGVVAALPRTPPVLQGNAGVEQEEQEGEGRDA